jgi:hypothetical protein
VAPPELRTAHPFIKLHWCETLVRALGAEGLDDRSTVIDAAAVNKNPKVFNVLRNMADINVASASSATMLESAAKVMRSVLGIVVEDGEPLETDVEVAALLQLRGQNFDAFTWGWRPQCR